MEGKQEGPERVNMIGSFVSRVVSNPFPCARIPPCSPSYFLLLFVLLFSASTGNFLPFLLFSLPFLPRFFLARIPCKPRN